MDIFRTDGNARVDALDRVASILEQALKVCPSDSILRPTVLHCKIALELAKGSSVQEAAASSGASRRTVNRVRHSAAMTLAVKQLQRLHHEEELRSAEGRLRQAQPDAIDALIAATKSGSVSAAKELLRLRSSSPAPTMSLPAPEPRTIEDHTSSTPTPTIPSTPHDQPNPTPTPTPVMPPQFIDGIRPIWTATSSKAEEHPSPDPENN